MAARRRRSVVPWALAAMAGAHGLVILWLAAQVTVLKFRAQRVADLSSMVVTLQPLAAATIHSRPAIRSPRTPEPLPAPEPAPSGPATVDSGPGLGEPANLAKPVYLDWPHPTPAGVNWGRPPEPSAGPRLALAGGWADCQRKDKDKDENAWASPGRVKPPCLNR